MPYRSNTARIRTLLLGAVDAGLVAGAEVYRSAVKRGLRGGYTSGDFVTGNVMNSVTRTDPEPSPDGGRQVRVGTNVDYAVFWELGHVNLFTRKYERVEVWLPALVENADRMRDAFFRVVNARLSGSPTLAALNLAPTVDTP